MKNKALVVCLIIIVILIVIFISTPNLSEMSRGDSSSGGKLGGDRDEHGCLIAAGYLWNETDQMCVREWEKTNCEKTDNKTEICIALYEPVCGLPIKKTFTNSCFACQDLNVKYYVEGECL